MRKRKVCSNSSFSNVLEDRINGKSGTHRSARENARIAQAAVAGYTRADRPRLYGRRMGSVTRRKHRPLAELAVSETRHGSIADMIQKAQEQGAGRHRRRALKVKSVGLSEEDPRSASKNTQSPRRRRRAQRPNDPTRRLQATPSPFEGRNASSSRRTRYAKNSTKLAWTSCDRGQKSRAPEDLIQVVEEPSIELTGNTCARGPLSPRRRAKVKAAIPAASPPTASARNSAISSPRTRTISTRQRRSKHKKPSTTRRAVPPKTPSACSRRLRLDGQSARAKGI